jgi:hypothetical protein
MQVLDVGAYLGSTQQQGQLPREIFLSLAQPHCLPSPDIALALYSITVSPGTNDTNWSYRGYVSNGRPSDVMPVFVDDLDSQPAAAYQIHVVVESMEEVSSKHLAKLAAKEDFCRRVGMDLFVYMQSFSQSNGSSDYITVPMNILDTWFNRISSKLRHDPDFLTRKKEII